MVKEDKEPTYILIFTYVDSGKTIEMSEKDLMLLGLPKETSDLKDYENWELNNLMAQYWHKNGVAIIREKLLDGTLSEPIEHNYIESITGTLKNISGSLSNKTRKDLEALTLESHVLDQQLVADRIQRRHSSNADY